MSPAASSLMPSRRAPRRPSAAFAAAAVAAAAALAAGLVGCGASNDGPRTVTLVDNQEPPAPKLDFGSLSLRMPVAQLRSVCQTEGWSVDGELADDGKVELVPPPSDPAKRYGVTTEAGLVVQLAIDFRQADERRVEMRHHYAVSKIQPDGSWAMTDAHRRALVMVWPHGLRLVALHIGSMRDQTGVRALLERTLQE